MAQIKSYMYNDKQYNQEYTKHDTKRKAYLTIHNKTYNDISCIYIITYIILWSMIIYTRTNIVHI